MPQDDITPESEARWQAWMARGRDRELRTRRKIRLSLLTLVFGGTIVAALVLGLR